MKIKSILIDDEFIARDVLRTYLTKYCPSIEIIGEAENIEQAEKLIKELHPDLIFLDVEMPFGNAFDLLENCENEKFETIFITAFSDYSIKALNMSASYYLLKPLSIEELIVAVNKVSETIVQSRSLNRTKILLENLKLNQIQQQIILPTINGFDVEKIETITRLQANGNFTDVYFQDNKKKMICRFLKHFEDILDFPFIRVHRSHIVNIQFVKSYSKSLGGFIIMHDGMEIEVSNSYKDNLMSVFK
jgi:two-component system, LytTR family, response regulator